MPTSSFCWESQIHISGKVHIRIAMNYLVNLHQTKVFPSELQCWPVRFGKPIRVRLISSTSQTSSTTLDGFNTVNVFSQIWVPYSKMGRTKTLKEVFIASESLDPNVLLIRPNTRNMQGSTLFRPKRNLLQQSTPGSGRQEVILKLNTIIFRLDLTIEYPVICKKLRAAANT